MSAHRYAPDRCSACGGPFHPATGHAWSEESRLCHGCAGRFFAWVVRHTGSRGGKRRVPTAESFYEAAATSVKGKE